MVDFYDLAEKKSISEIKAMYPISADFFDNLNLNDIADNMPVADALEKGSQEWLDELGTDVEDVLEQFADFMSTLTSPEDEIMQIHEITVVGGHDKSGNPENVDISVCPGDVVSIVGPTGSGKSRLLGDIECMARATPRQEDL